MDQLFFAVARHIDWMALARRVLRDAYDAGGLSGPTRTPASPGDG